MNLNRFVYLVHLEYRDSVQPPAPGTRFDQERLSSKLVARLPGELRRYLPDTQVRISNQPIKRDPGVIQLTVVTMLDEATADAAFVRFIRDCKAALLQEAPEAT
jgi:hypothetical protein